MVASTDESSAGEGPPPDRTGELVADKYQLEQLLGEGGMGSVWRAHNVALGIDVAIKLHHGGDPTGEAAQRLAREAQVAARLEHPAAVRVFDLGRTALGEPFIVMELLRGQSLRDLLDRRRLLAPEEAVRLLLPILGAMAAAHTKGIVHRDLKPENMILAMHEDGLLPKVIDFGIARLADGADGVDGGGSQRVRMPSPTWRTTCGAILGSPTYMAPEQARGDIEAIGPACDVWSMAIVLYEAVSGAPPFDAEHPLTLLRLIMEDAHRPLDDPDASVADARAVDPAFARILDGALAKDPAARWPDMRVFGRRLAEWAIERGVENDATGASIAATWLRPTAGAGKDDIIDIAKRTDTAMEAHRPPPPPRRRLGPAVLALSLVALGLVAGVARGRASSAGVALPMTLPAPPPAALVEVAQAIESAPSARIPAPGSVAPEGSATPSGSDAALVQAASDPRQVASCITARFPADAFHADAPLADVCAEGDPRRGAALLRAHIARHGMARGRTTEAMQTWAMLSWYELAAVTTARHACCAAEHLTPTALPPTIGTCDDLGATLDALGDAVRTRADLAASVARFRTAVVCADRGRRINEGANPYPYEGPPGNGADAAFARLLARAR